MESEKNKEKYIRDLAECIYQSYPPICKMVICFLYYKEGKVSGYLKSVYYDDRVFYFNGLDHLLLLMEDIMDTADNPQRSVNYRNIHGRSLRRQAEIFAKSDTWQTTSVFEDEEVKEINLKKTALSVQVYSRRNSSIQGELYIDPDKRVFFRSGIELIRMLYEYLDSMERKNC